MKEPTQQGLQVLDKEPSGSSGSEQGATLNIKQQVRLSPAELSWPRWLWQRRAVS